MMRRTSGHSSLSVYHFENEKTEKRNYNRFIIMLFFWYQDEHIWQSQNSSQYISCGLAIQRVKERIISSPVIAVNHYEIIVLIKKDLLFPFPVFIFQAKAQWRVGWSWVVEHSQWWPVINLLLVKVVVNLVPHQDVLASCKWSEHMHPCTFS